MPDPDGSGARDPETYAIIGAAIEVHRCLGHGFLEPVYQDAFAMELADRGVPFEREAQIPVSYKGRPLSAGYRADFVCYGSVIVELKAQAAIGGVEDSQVINYLKATGYKRGLLFNFGKTRLESKRLVV